MELASFNTEWEICPYLHDRASRQRVRLVDRVSDEDYSRLLAEGWRRFGRIVFRPACGSCQECVPIRVLVDRFRPTKSQRRVLRRNADVRVELGDPKVDGARLDLYHRFHA
ncbi:MAG TPA: arginyltransferase, partial [Planctomycetota bacterium]|nr:arginyltransferase [Planctomycetota bacterium]